VPRPEDRSEPKRTAWFWWTLVNLLALCLVVVSWTFCLEVLNRPEIAGNYQILRKLGRLPQYKAFRQGNAPEGRVLGPDGIYRMFFGLSDGQYGQLNRLFRRNFMANFDEARAVTYVAGEYEVIEAHPFSAEGFMPQGFVVRARAVMTADDFSKPSAYPVIVECLMPTADPDAIKAFAPGKQLILDKFPHLPVVLEVSRQRIEEEAVVCVTVLPIGYGRFTPDGGRSFELAPPEWIRPEGKLK
jgi:hypothetical protein